MLKLKTYCGFHELFLKSSDKIPHNCYVTFKAITISFFLKVYTQTDCNEIAKENSNHWIGLIA